MGELDEEAVDQISMNASQTNEKEHSASQMIEIEHSTPHMNENALCTSRLIEHRPRASQMNANNDQRTNEEHLSDDNSEIFMGKADLYLTEGSLSLDELDDSNVRLSWRTDEKPSVSAISAYVIEVKTKGGVWREIR